MANLSGKEKSVYVQDVFTRIASRYDLMNKLMTGGQDVHWRDQVIKLAKLKSGDNLLDLGSGTGDLARTAMTSLTGINITAADFTLEMMRAGRKQGDQFSWANADALALPFFNDLFDAVISGFLMRNVIDRKAALEEQRRVLRAGGRIVILDTTRPSKNLLSPFIWIHLHLIIPLLGTMLSGQSDAYTYLPDSTEAFLSAEELAELMKGVGFKNVGFKRLMFGTIAIHWGEN
ncbi:MAG: ubiquinone/menaquinone biosynthesis methyltransferase [Chloroflexota bacterium]